MPNHWHFVLQPTEAGGMSDFLRWATLTQTMRYHSHYHTAGEGHVYQGRFKSFPVQDDDHFHVLHRDIERNALRAKLVKHAKNWRWGLSIAGFNQVNLYHDCCRDGRWPDQLTGSVASTNRWTTRNSMVFAGRSDGAMPSGNRIGSNRLRVDWISNQRCDRVDAQKKPISTDLPEKES